MNILYHEVLGGGADTEANLPWGIVVTLAFFESSDTWRIPDHYLLRSRVMVDHEIVVDNCVIEAYGLHHDAKMIRKAVKLFDELERNHPNVGMEKGE